ncbi:MAG: type I-B CRISPR-associated protein Cas7/Csh2 [Atribacterota bacterium]
MTEVKKRREILFLYDVTNNNPNGDPIDDNKPRIDQESGKNIVTDVRLKRTIRDYLLKYDKEPIFIKEEKKQNGDLVTKKERVKNEKIEKDQDLVDRFIDIRLFGATTAIKKNTITFTGPVQFKLGTSLHKVDLTHLKGTTVSPSGTSRKQGTFTEKYILPYSLICFYGIVNENTAKTTGLKKEDVDKMLIAIWKGTKNLSSASKIGHMPRLLVEVIYDENDFHIGELDKTLQLQSEKDDKQIRGLGDFIIDASKFKSTIEQYKDKIQKIRIKKDAKLSLYNWIEEGLTERMNLD